MYTALAVTFWFDGLAGGEELRLEFPMPETTEQYTICGTRYTVSLRGNTVVDITPRETEDEAAQNKYLFFQREDLKSGSTPMHEVKRFVPSQVLARAVSDHMLAGHIGNFSDFALSNRLRGVSVKAGASCPIC